MLLHASFVCVQKPKGVQPSDEFVEHDGHTQSLDDTSEGTQAVGCGADVLRHHSADELSDVDASANVPALAHGGAGRAGGRGRWAGVARVPAASGISRETPASRGARNTGENRGAAAGGPHRHCK